jgi:hypothetical protein
METGQKIQPQQLKQALENIVVKLQESPAVANDHPLIVNFQNRINTL